jgi:hypothetical protein
VADLIDDALAEPDHVERIERDLGDRDGPDRVLALAELVVLALAELVEERVQRGGVPTLRARQDRAGDVVDDAG